MSPNSEGEYGLVMPFVICRSQGGPYDDTAFVVGMELGGLSAELHTCAALPQGLRATPAGRYVHTGALPQLDLIAMRHGYAVTPGDPDDETEPVEGWTWVDFRSTQFEETPDE